MPLQEIPASADTVVVWRLDAPRARVWECLTGPTLLPHWLGELVQGGVAAGSTFVVDHGEGFRCRSRVLAWQDRARLALSWEFPDEAPSEVDIGLDDAGLDDAAAAGDVLAAARLAGEAAGPLARGHSSTGTSRCQDWVSYLVRQPMET